MSTKTVCNCGRGYASAYDDKCGHCRTKKEVKARELEEFRHRRTESKLETARQEILKAIQRVNSK